MKCLETEVGEHLAEGLLTGRRCLVFKASYDLSNILFGTLGAVNHVNNILSVTI